MIEKYDKIINSQLHDYEIFNIIICYVEAWVTIQLQSPHNIDFEIRIKDFTYFNFTHNEPWGMGIYVVSSNIEEVDSNSLRLFIELNSGDCIEVICKK